MHNNIIKKVLSNYTLSTMHRKNTSFSYCTLDERQDIVFFLDKPKLVYLLEKLDNNVGSSELLVEGGFLNKTQKNKQNVNNFNNKFERKNKNTIRLNEEVDNNKKNKIKNKRKNRNKLNAENDDIFFENSHRESGEHIDVLNLALMRPAKSNKQKRKRKWHQDIIDFNPIKNNKKNIITDEKSITDQSYISKEVVLDSPLTIHQLSDKLQISEASIITWLFLQGISVTINQVVDISIAQKVAKHYDFTILEHNISNTINSDIRALNISKGIKRPPIITIFGHVDHGKTTLLDSIRKTNLVNLEAGGITQSIKGYEVEWEYMSSIEKLIFLDTPGHEAFTGMRLRSAEITDLAILLVAADDGLKPQSIEAVNHIISRKIPYIVVINKIDKEDIDISKIKEELTKYNIMDKEWGGQNIILEVSALTGKNIDILLSNICALSQLHDFKAEPSSLAEGTIIEAHLDKKIGPVATIVIKNGTLRVGDTVISGNTLGRVKLLTDTFANKINQAGPSSIIEMSGFSSIPQAGLKFYSVNDEKKAKQLILNNLKSHNSHAVSKLLNTRVTLDSYNSKNCIKQVNLILKTDTQGSIEAVIHSFSQISQEKVQINIISCSSGSISDTDIDLAITSNSLILGFNITISNTIYNTAEKLGVQIKNFNVIYDLLDFLKDYMLNLIDPDYDEVSIGQAAVQTVFNINKGIVAGCIVTSGKLKKNANIRIYRDDNLVHEGLLDSLKRVKEDADEVTTGHECGVMCLNYNLWHSFDRIEAYELIEKERSL